VDISEKDFETTIYEHLASHGYTPRDASCYDPALCLDIGALFQFLFATQPQKWEKLKLQHGPQVMERLFRSAHGEV